MSEPKKPTSKEDASEKAVAESYSEAISELEAILDELSNKEVDVDALAAQVERAAELIEYCQAKINKAEMRVNKIVEGIEQEEQK